MNKHNKGDLQQLQSLPLEAKILMTQRRIRDWVDYWGGDVYVSFSGGKDSTVLKHIVDGMYDNIPSVFVNTGLEFSEIQRFVREIKAGKYDCFNSDVEIIRPEMRFDEVIKEYGYPIVSKEVSQVIEEVRRHLATGKHYSYRLKRINGELLDKNGNKSRFNCDQWKFLLDADFKISSKCCDVMKKKPVKKYERATNRKGIIGTMAAESLSRGQAWMKTGCNAYESKRPLSKPMSFWTEQDVLHYIKQFNVPYCPVYGEIKVAQHGEIEGQMNMIDCLGCYEPEDKLETTGCKRTGCVYCLFGCHLEASPNRIQRLKQTHPKQYEYCIGGGEWVDGKWQPSKEGLGLKKVLEYIGVPYE